jgi:hypothetical protein
MLQSVKQFKLTNNDEIICEVMDSIEDGYVISKALKISTFSTSDDKNYYIFKPFMVYQTKPNNVILLNLGHIISSANPDPDLIEQYDYALALMEKETEEEVKEESLNDLMDEVFKSMDPNSTDKFH